MSQTQRISYQRTAAAFRIQSEGRRYVMPINTWNKFLKRHGKLPDNKMESRHGTLSVDQDAFNKMVYSREVNMSINVEVTELIKYLSKGITDINYDAPADEYLKEIAVKVSQLQKRLRFFQHNVENITDLDKKTKRKILMDFTV